MPSDRAYEKARCPQGERIDAKLKETLHNAFYDRRFKPKGNFMKINYFEDTDTALIEFTSYTAKKQIPISLNLSELARESGISKSTLRSNRE